MNLAGEFDKARSYLSKSRNYIYFITGLFFLSALIGFSFHLRFDFILDILRGIIDKTEGLGTLDLIVYIFFNNLRAALFGMLGGLFLGIFPLFNAVSNGLVLGYVFERVYEKSGFLDFWRILPHGIFELPAIFISLGLGVKLGGFLFNDNSGKTFVERARNSLKVFFLIVLPLLVVAAIIEGYLIGLLG